MRQRRAKDGAEPRLDEETGGVFDLQEPFAQRALARWWETLSASEQRALQGPERRRRWRRGTQASHEPKCNGPRSN